VTDGDGRRGRARAAALRSRNRAWREVALARRLSGRAVKRARLHLLVLLPAAVAVQLLYAYRIELLGHAWDTAMRFFTAVALVVLGWGVTRDVGRALAPTLFKRLDPGTAGTVGFVVRLLSILVSVVLALRVAGLSPRTLAVGGAVTAVVVGLAAQQTLGNVFAGTVLLSARPFRIGERVRLQGGGLAGTLEGRVSALGLLYTTLFSGEDPIMVPNSIVLNSAIVPLREPTGVDLRARLRPGVTPMDIQELLNERVETPVRDSFRISLEELYADGVVIRIAATPEHPADGAKLAGAVVKAIESETVPAGSTP
jgi:small conductance mechanosensitive channel